MSKNLSASQRNIRSVGFIIVFDALKKIEKKNPITYFIIASPVEI